MPDRPATAKTPVNPEAIHNAQAEAGVAIEAERRARIEARDNPGHHPSLAAALVAFQAEMPKVAKGQTATIPGKDGRTGYSYKYADLADVADAATPILTRHGLAFITLPGFTPSGSPILRGMILHALGESLEAEGLPLYGRTAQDIGSSLTYNRRYLFGCLTGVVTDEDEDGSIAAATRAALAAPPVMTPEQTELTAELEALDGPTAELVRARWPHPGRGPGALSMGEINQVRALVDVVIGEQAQAATSAGVES